MPNTLQHCQFCKQPFGPLVVMQKWEDLWVCNHCFRWLNRMEAWEKLQERKAQKDQAREMEQQIETYTEPPTRGRTGD